MSSSTVSLDGRTLELEAVERVARHAGTHVALAPEAAAAMEASRTFIADKVASGERVYGVTTGFGRLADVVIAPEERGALQRNLVRSHAAGMGEPLDTVAVPERLVAPGVNV